MIQEAIARLVAGESLSQDEAAAAMTEIMDGTPTPAQFGAFVTALRLKGETVDEIAGCASIMRARARQVTPAVPVIDTCGTGGVGAGHFNVSTAAAFVVAGAGQAVAKHGNRGVTRACGSADVLDALGTPIELSPPAVVQCLEEAGFGFMFAPAYHPAMKFATPLRREIGIRTVFNILGPLTNPAGARAQVLGVGDASIAERMAAALGLLGIEHALVVHGDDGPRRAEYQRAFDHPRAVGIIRQDVPHRAGGVGPPAGAAGGDPGRQSPGERCRLAAGADGRRRTKAGHRAAQQRGGVGRGGSRGGPARGHRARGHLD